MTQRVTFVELPVFTGVVPLASGYMEAFARHDPLVASQFEFDTVSLSVKTPFADAVAA